MASPIKSSVRTYLKCNGSKFAYFSGEYSLVTLKGHKYVRYILLGLNGVYWKRLHQYISTENRSMLLSQFCL